MRMVARAQTMILAMAVLLLMSACHAMTGETTGQYFSDSAITTAVKAKLASQDRAATLTRVGVETNQGVVTLTGVAKDDASKKLAGELAASVRGVQGVNNNLQVQGQPPAGSQG